MWQPLWWWLITVCFKSKTCCFKLSKTEPSSLFSTFSNFTRSSNFEIRSEKIEKEIVSQTISSSQSFLELTKFAFSAFWCRDAISLSFAFKFDPFLALHINGVHWLWTVWLCCELWLFFYLHQQAGVLRICICDASAAHCVSLIDLWCYRWFWDSVVVVQCFKRIFKPFCIIFLLSGDLKQQGKVMKGSSVIIMNITLDDGKIAEGVGVSSVFVFRIKFSSSGEPSLHKFTSGVDKIGGLLLWFTIFLFKSRVNGRFIILSLGLSLLLSLLKFLILMSLKVCLSLNFTLVQPLDNFTVFKC